MFFKNIRDYENFHIVLWLFKDICWILDFKAFGTFMIFPTFIAAVYITWRWRSIQSELFHNIPVCLWICANGIWMIGEFYYDDGLRPAATVFFLIGILIVAIYYLIILPLRWRKRKQTVGMMEENF